MTSPRGARLTLVLLSLSLAVLTPATAALAQGPAGPMSKLSDAQRKEVTSLREALQQLAPKLGEIQKKAMQKQPKLAKRASKLQALIEATMKRHGVDPNKAVKRLQAIQAQVQTQGPKLAGPERKKLMAEFIRLRNALQMGEQRAMADKKVKAAREAFRKRLEAAMVKADPTARKLLAQFKKLTDRLKKLLGA